MGLLTWIEKKSDKVVRHETAKCSDCSARATDMPTNPCHVSIGAAAAFACTRACMLYAFRDIGYDGCSRHWRMGACDGYTHHWLLKGQWAGREGPEHAHNSTILWRPILQRNFDRTPLEVLVITQMTFHHTTTQPTSCASPPQQPFTHWQPVLQPDCLPFHTSSTDWRTSARPGERSEHAHSQSRHINMACEQCTAPESQAWLQSQHHSHVLHTGN